VAPHKAGCRPSISARRLTPSSSPPSFPDCPDGRLTLQGRRDARVSCEQYHQVERGHGEFARSLALPAGVDVDNISADLRDGVLTITVPKAPENAARRVSVS
jgi:HSP20 family molecular chaperone IbpA